MPKIYVTFANREFDVFMISSSIQNVIPVIQNYLASQPVEKAWLFGSCSRGEESSDSDIDILVRYTEDENVSLFSISRIMTSLSNLLGRKVDLVEDGCLMPFARESAERDKILIYERAMNIGSFFIRHHGHNGGKSLY